MPRLLKYLNYILIDFVKTLLTVYYVYELSNIEN